MDFWMLREDQFKACEARHNVEPGVFSIMEKRRSSSYEGTASIQTSGTCYFVFLNKNNGPVSITLHVDGGMQTEVVTSMNEQVGYLTQTTPFVTETVSFITHPVGLGLIFYSGIGLIIVAGIVLTVSRMKGAAPRTVQPSKPQPAPPVSMPAQGQTEETRYVEHLAKLEELETRGEISEKTYLKLRREYLNKPEQDAR